MPLDQPTAASAITRDRIEHTLRGVRLTRADADRLAEFIESRTVEPGERVGVRVVSPDPTAPLIVEIRASWWPDTEPTNVGGVAEEIRQVLGASLEALEARGFDIDLSEIRP